MNAIQNGRVVLRPTTKSDLADLIRLWNDGRVMKWVSFPNGLGYTDGQMKQWLEALQANPNRHHFMVIADEIGFCGEVYYEVDALHQRAGLDIKLIPDAQGRGIATEALTLLIAHVFHLEAQVQSVWTEPGNLNLTAKRLYKRCGLGPAIRPPDLPTGTSYWELRRPDTSKES